MKKLLKPHFIILFGIFFLIFILRFPSLFEPFWYGDEGIFAAVGRNLNLGGTLYQSAWDNKPPMIFLTYASIFKIFGVSMFWVRFAGLVFVLGTAAAIYEIAQAIMGERKALVASFLFGVITSLRLIEGNLALTEILMILPISLAMLIAVKRNFDLLSLFVSGFLIAVASLYKQVGALEAAALGIFLFFISKNFVDFFKKGLILTIGFALPYVFCILYFYPKGLLDDWVFAAYTYYQIYFEESPQRAIAINILKFAPIIVTVIYGFYKKYKFKKVNISHLFFFWMAFSFLGSFFSGRTYGHYLVQAVPATCLVLASINFKLKFKKAQILFGIFFFVPLLILIKILFTDFVSAGPLNQISYWKNFLEYSAGKKTVDSYNNYFDGNVNTIMSLNDFLRINKANGKSVYIWGDYPWLYAISDLKDPVRYVTSFHVFGVPTGRDEVISGIRKSPPVYIIKPQSSIGYFEDLEKIIAVNYTLVGQIENAQVWQLRN